VIRVTGPSLVADWGQLPLAWLLTYGIHSTLLLGGVWLLTATVARSTAARELLWRAALVGGLLTATVQVAGAAPLAGELPLPAASPAAGLADVGDPASAPGGVSPTGGPLQADGPPHSAGTASSGRNAGEAAAGTASGPAADDGASDGAAAALRRLLREQWAMAPVGLWLVGAALGLARLAGRRRRLRAALGPRRPVDDPRLAAMLRQLGGQAHRRRPVRLTCSASLASPVALGRGEICVPARALTDLGAAEQRAMLAHELAHLLRRDPAWLGVAAAVEAVLWPQPLNRVARRRTQELAEQRCDTWAAARTGPLALVRCLAAVASWLDPRTEGAMPAGMVGGGSPLLHRVRRLLEPGPGPAGEPGRLRRACWAVVAGGLLVMVGCSAPGVTGPEPSPQPRAAPPGLLVFSSDRGDGNDLYLMAADGSGLRRLATGQFDPSLAAWSPDGRRIAFNAGRWPDVDLYVIGAGGGNPRRLTFDGAENAHPSWSPDGRRIAFASARDGNLEIYTMDADGGDLRRLTRSPAADDHKPVWSPDGQRIAFSSKRGGGVDLYVMDARGGAARRLTDHPATDMNPAWSPGGERIAFNSNRAGAMELYVMDAAGGDQRRLLASAQGAWDEKPAWSPDGSRIAFWSNRDGDPDVYLVDAGGANLRRLTTANPRFDGLPAFAPNRGATPTR
jgi:Tol biopolymer transport system component